MWQNLRKVLPSKKVILSPFLPFCHEQLPALIPWRVHIPSTEHVYLYPSSDGKDGKRGQGCQKNQAGFFFPGLENQVECRCCYTSDFQKLELLQVLAMEQLCV